jgi:hypothetical protein
MSRSMLSEIDVLKDVTERLDALRIPYMLTGSFAMSYFASRSRWTAT